MNEKRILTVAVGLLAVTWSVAHGDTDDSEPQGCLTCHQGIEPIREEGSQMMVEILELGEAYDDPGGCTVCHGGDASASEKEEAHAGFYPDPGSPWVNEETCGQCHEEQVRVQWQSLMMTEAGKIHGVCWAFGSLHLEAGAESGYEHLWANYDVENPEDPADRRGTDVYRAYMEKLSILEPQVFVQKHLRLPDAPTDLKQLEGKPEQAAFTYLRNQCLRCHHAVKGRQKRGDYRGMGCSSCHIPYGNEGFYEGDDPTIAKDQPGHALVHSIQATREAKVVVHGKQYSGIPVETCTTCHDRGKRIGVSFQGLMETPYESPFTEDGEHQPALHTKHYIAMHQDIHYQKGMLCLDCHTSIDVHGDGFLAAANLGAVQIECADCHGTPDQFPWELPIGYGDEFDATWAAYEARGTTTELPDYHEQGTVFPPRDGYLLTARGNPFGNVVRDGDSVMVHLASGKDIELSPLKLLEREEKLTEAGHVAMAEISPHMSKMECYTCHAAWAPQCYGCHVKIDYSGGKTCFDWLGAGHRHQDDEDSLADRGESGYDTIVPGTVEEQRSYMRWEDPILGVNGENRVTPVAPGCQPAITVVGEDGKPLLLNHLFRTPPGTEGGGEEGQLAADMSPGQPHTMSREARTCESCHLSEKALGYGIGGGRQTRPWDEDVVVDLETADKALLPQQYQVQREAMEGLSDDWSRIVSEDGSQLMTVGHHFKHSRPLNDKERSHVDRAGVCLSCHQEIPEGSLAVSLLHHVAERAGQSPKTRKQHNSLLHKILLLAGWVQVVIGGAIPLFVLFVGYRVLRRRRRSR